MRRALLISLFLLALAAPEGHAAVPGANGMLSYTLVEPSSFVSEELHTVNPSGTGDRIVAYAEGTAGIAAFAPNGNELAWEKHKGCLTIWRTPFSGDGEQNLTAGCSRDASWSVDGERLAYFSYDTDNAAKGTVWVMNRDGTGKREAYFTNCVIGNDMVWAVDGRVYFHYYGQCLNEASAWGVWSIDPDLPGGDPRREFQGGDSVTASHFGSGIQGIDVSPDGKTLLMSVQVDDGADTCEDGTTLADPGDLYKLTLGNRSSLQRLTFTPTLVERSVAWSPDGTQIAVTAYDATCGVTKPESVYTLPSAGGDVYRVTHPGLGGFGLQTRHEGVSWQRCVPAVTISCVSEPKKCGNGGDDDGDGWTDTDDPGCEGTIDDSEHGPWACDDGLDNDLDGKIDFRENGQGDPGCVNLADDDEIEGDIDEDGVADWTDNCPSVWNPVPQQVQDDDDDDVGDACDDYDCKLYGSGIPGCMLQPGDVLLWRSSDPSWVETEMGDTYFSHAAIVLGYVDLDEKTGAPTTESCDDPPKYKGDPDPGCELVIADAVPDEETGEVAIRSMPATLFGAGNVPPGNYYGAFRLGLSAATRHAAADWMLEHLLGAGGAGQEVNQTDTVWNAPNFDYNIAFSGLLAGTNYYCSSLVWRAYHEVGVDLDGHDAWYVAVDRSYVTPDDLIDNDIGGTWLLPPPQGTVVSTAPAASARGASSGKVHVMLVDEQGRRTGRDVNGVLHQEIPFSWWKSSPERGESVSAQGAGDDWKVVVSGYEAGRFRLLARTMGEIQTGESVQGPAEPGVVREIAFGDLESLIGAVYAVDDAATLESGEHVLADVLANDWSPDGFISSVHVVSPPEHGTASVVNNKVGYTAAADYVGPDELTYRACTEPSKCDVAKLELTVNVNPPGPPGGPGLSDDAFELAGGTTRDFDVLANDVDGYGGLDPATLSLVGTGGGNTVKSLVDGKLRVEAPATNGPLPDGIYYTVCNVKGVCAEAHVDITVTPGGFPPPPDGSQPAPGNVVPTPPGPSATPTGQAGDPAPPARTTLEVRRRGRRLVLSGTAARGRRVELQYLAGRRWKPLGTAAVRGGKWSRRVRGLPRGTLVRARPAGGAWVRARVR